MIKRIVQCDTCSAVYMEQAAGEGFPGWGQLSGVVVDGKDNPHLCPECLGKVATFVDGLKGE